MVRIRRWLWVGKLRDTREPALLAAEGIGALLQLAGRTEDPALVTLHLPVEDGLPLPPETLDRAVEFVRGQREAGRVTLITCGLGISRASSLAVAVLKELEGRSLLAAYFEVKRLHPEARPHPVLWQSLCDHYGEKFSIADLFR